MSAAREEAELIQVMAVACASIENMRYGQASAEAWTPDDTMQGFAVLDHVFNERVAQDAKWGEQGHSRIEWAMILAEEIGEWAAELVDESAGDPYEAYVLGRFVSAGKAAREWLENHEWPERQQQVYDAEASEGS